MRRWWAMVLAGSMGFQAGAATLEVYRDGALYRFAPEKPFVGFVGEEARVVCKERESGLETLPQCPDDSRLCREKRRIETLEFEAREAEAAGETLKKVAGNVKPQRLDAKKLITESEAIGRRLAELRTRLEERRKAVRIAKERFLQTATSWEAAALPADCTTEAELRMPAGWITFEVFYDADVTDRGQIAITQNMGVTNRSGVDIRARKAAFHYAPMRRNLRPVRFSPWLVYDASVPKPRTLYRKGAPVVAMEAAPAAELSGAKVEASRHYVVRDLVLPSDGRRTTVALRRWSQEAEYGEVAYPYRDSRVYETVRFTPAHPIDAERWRIHEKGRLLSSRVTGAFVEGRYTLFLDVDEAVKVHRQRLYLKAKESFFGGTVKKRDGYRIELVNDSPKAKKITLVDRIPVARRSDVEVKLLKVSSALPLRYELKPQGRLEMHVTLPARGNGAVEVLFEVSHDKDKPVRY